MPYFRIYDLRSTYATRLSAGGVADEWVTQLLRQGDAKVFKKYSQMKLQMKREALKKINHKANEGQLGFDTERGQLMGFRHGLATVGCFQNGGSGLKSEEVPHRARSSAG